MSQVVIGDVLPYTQATATLNQTVFGTNWTANAASDVVVYRTPSGDAPSDVTDILAYPAAYSVAFIGDQQQVQVTLVTPAGAGDIITITRQTPADRMNLYSNTNFTPNMLNNDFGILTLVDQQAQLVDQKIGPRYNYSATTIDVVDTILPVLTANQGWVKNSNNTGFIGYTFPASGSGIAPANSKYVLQSADSSLPNSFVLTAGTNVTLTPGGGSLTISSSNPGGTVTSITAGTGLTGGTITHSGTIALNTAAMPAFIMTGAINMNSNLINNVTDPVSAQDAMTLNYAGAHYLPFSGGTMTGNISMGGSHRVINALDPLNPQDYATKNYVDQTALSGTSAYTATTTSLGTVTQSGAGVGATLTNAGTQAVLSIGGVNPPVGVDVLVKNTATGMTAANQGLYTVTNVGSNSTNWSMVRKTGYDIPEEINNTGLIVIRNGSLAGTSWYNANTIVTVDTTNFNFLQFGASPVSQPWTPVITAGSGSFNSITYSQQTGEFFVFGNILFYTFVVTVSSVSYGTAGSSLQIAPPILPVGTTPVYDVAYVNNTITNFIGPMIYTPYSGGVFVNVVSTNTSAAVASTDIQNGTSLRGNGFYFI